MPDDYKILDDWLAEVESLQRRLEPDRLYSVAADDLRPYAHALRDGIAAVRRARERDDPSLLIEEMVWLARSLETARVAEGELWVAGLRKQLEATEEVLQDIERALVETEDGSEARLAALDRARQKRQEERADLARKLETLRPEFEKLRGCLGASRAAKIFASRHPELGLMAGAIRKRLAKQPR